jgi:hypothetical protein
MNSCIVAAEIFDAFLKMREQGLESIGYVRMRCPTLVQKALFGSSYATIVQPLQIGEVTQQNLGTSPESAVHSTGRCNTMM